MLTICYTWLMLVTTHYTLKYNKYYFLKLYYWFIYNHFFSRIRTVTVFLQFIVEYEFVVSPKIFRILLLHYEALSHSTPGSEGSMLPMKSNHAVLLECRNLFSVSFYHFFAEIAHCFCLFQTYRSLFFVSFVFIARFRKLA